MLASYNADGIQHEIIYHITKAAMRVTVHAVKYMYSICIILSSWVQLDEGLNILPNNHMQKPQTNNLWES